MGVPKSGLPNDSCYTVCVSSKQLNAIFAPFCSHANHCSRDESISVALNLIYLFFLIEILFIS